MTDYTKTTDFTSKDSLPSGDSGKIIRGAEFGTEFDNIQTAVNSKSNINNPAFTGNITVTGTVDGRDIAADGTKLDTIETSADVTDTANVTAAGAVMDSELTDITAVKALNQGVATTDSPTFAAVTSTGNVTVGGTVDGRDVATDGTKLDTVETNADVTDTTNVTAAGALMDSEVTNLAQVKAFDSADYATAAQGTTADNALPKTGGAMTGAITTNSTFDGRDVATDGTKLDGIEASADVTDTTNVTAAGALMDSELTSEASVKALNQGVATTDSPTFAGIDVTGTVTADEADIGEFSTSTNVFQGNVGGTGARLRAVVSSNSNPTFSFDTDTDTGMYTAGANTLNFTTGGVQRIRLDSAGDISFYDSAGSSQSLFWDASAESLGIGTSSINTSKLHVQGSTGTASAVRAESTAADSDAYYIADNDASVWTWGIDGGNSDAWTLSNAFGLGTPKMTVTTGGSVGIGTDDPASNLHLTGAATGLTIEGTTRGDLFLIDSGAATDQKRKTIRSFDGNLIFGTENDAINDFAEAMRISSDGSVGIGSSLPSVPLEVEGSVKFGSAATGVSFAIQSTDEYRIDGIDIDGNGFNSLHFRADGTDGLFIQKDTNNVGIGSNNPARLLHLSAPSGDNVPLRVEAGATTTASYIDLKDASTTADFKVRVGSNGDEFVTYAGGTERLRISSDGSVGLGVDLPAQPLHVDLNGTSTAYKYLQLDGDGGLGSVSGQAGVGFRPIGAGNNVHASINALEDGLASYKTELTFNVNKVNTDSAPTEAMRISSDGSVNITNTVSATLSLQGGDGNSKNIVFKKTTGGTQQAKIQAVGDDLRFITGSGTDEAFRVDSSQNLLVGTTDSSVYNNNANSSADNGINLMADGKLYATKSGASVAIFNRTSSDGNIVEFNKSGTSVGSIGTRGGDVYVETGDTGIRMYDQSDAIIPIGSAGVSRDAAIDLGISNIRFKDLYLSGGVYLGGVAAANKLDDYEEGTFTPVMVGSTTAGTGTYTVQSGHYTKIGNTVTAHVLIQWSAHTGTGNIQITGFPVNPAGTHYIVPFTSALTLSSGYTAEAFIQSNNLFNLYQVNATGSSIPVPMDTSAQVAFTVTYRTS